MMPNFGKMLTPPTPTFSMKALILSLAFLTTLTTAMADGGPTAKEAVQTLGRERGKTAAQYVIFLSGTRGSDQPLGWRMITRDPKTGLYAEHYCQGRRIVSSKGAQPLTAQPVARRWVVDSSAAFAIAERAANKNRIGFDSVDYQLRCLDLSDRPVWFLTLWNHSGAKSGEITVAADNGAVLRKAWFPAGRVVPQHRSGGGIAQAPQASGPAPRSGMDAVKDTLSQTTRKVSGFFNRLFGSGQQNDYLYSPPPAPGSR